MSKDELTLSTSIVDAILTSPNRLYEDFQSVIREPSQVLKALETDLREQGEFILAFQPEHVLRDRSLVAVDGGRATEQLSGGDLIVAGATLADGYRSQQMFGDSPIAEGQATIIPHTADGDNKVGGALMFSMELRIIAQAARAGVDHIILDGLYLLAVSDVLHFLLKNPKQADRILEMDEDGLLSEGMERILKPNRDNPAALISIAKSDSSYVLSRQMFGKDHPMADRVNDRMLATRLLEPGEFFKPRTISSNNVLISEWKKREKTLTPKVAAFLKGKYEALLSLGGTSDGTYENNIYTTYFKPSLWERSNRAIKVEFVYFKNSTKTLTEQAEEVIQIVNDDIVDASIMEPYSQYLVDLRAKEVSQAKELSYNTLIESAESSDELMSVLYGYRT